MSSLDARKRISWELEFPSPSAFLRSTSAEHEPRTYIDADTAIELYEYGRKAVRNRLPTGDGNGKSDRE